MTNGIKPERVSPLMMDDVADPVETNDYVSVLNLAPPVFAELLAVGSPYRTDPVIQSDHPVERLEEGQIGLDRVVWTGGG